MGGSLYGYFMQRQKKDAITVLASHFRQQFSTTVAGPFWLTYEVLSTARETDLFVAMILDRSDLNIGALAFANCQMVNYHIMHMPSGELNHLLRKYGYPI